MQIVFYSNLDREKVLKGGPWFMGNARVFPKDKYSDFYPYFERVEIV